MPSRPRTENELLKHEIRLIMLLVARTAARVEDLIVECSDCRALYDARLDLEVALEKLYWLIPDRGLPWMERKTYDGTRNWYEITDLHHRSLINRWAGIYAKRFDVDIDKRSIERFHKLLGEDFHTCERPASPPPPPLALPLPSEFECVRGTGCNSRCYSAAQTAPFTTPQISTS